jgi:N-acetylglucosamine kinase-like BadF-type ATPase
LNIASAFRCYNDTFAALRAGSTRPYGVAVICGTGFNACAITPDGRHFKLFSLGRYTGDWGGGYSMGEAAMGAIYRADDGRGEATVLTDMVLQALGKPDLATLADDIAARRLDNRRVAGLAPLIFDAAEGGDGVARGIIQRLADEIVITASAMLRRGDMGSREADVVLSGGVMHGRGSLLLNSVTSQLAARHPNATVQRLAVAPVVGAAWLAYDALKLPAPTVIAHHFPLNTPVTPSAVS